MTDFILATAEPRANSLREERGRAQTALLDNRGRLILLRSEARVFYSAREQADDGDARTRRQRLTNERNRLQAEARTTEDSLVKEREAMAALRDSLPRPLTFMSTMTMITTPSRGVVMVAFVS